MPINARNSAVMRTLAVSAVLVLPVASALAAQDADSTHYEAPSSINMSATVRRSAPPDRVLVYLVVDAPAPTGKLASSRAQSTAKDVEASLRHAAAGLTVDVTDYGAGPAPQVAAGRPNLAADVFIGRSVVRVDLDRLELLPAVIDAAFASGATALGALTFELAAADSLRRAALADAIVQVQHDAETVAQQLGKRVGRLVSLNSNQAYNLNPQPVQLSVDNQFQASQPWRTPPVVAVSATVYATYRVLGPDER
jgi:uncharacterized protein YggE